MTPKDNMTSPGGRIGIYCLDQDHSTTSSVGLYNYLKRLIGALSQMPDPGFEVVLLLSSANRDELVPKSRPAWLSTYICAGAYGSGLRRLKADHIIVRRLIKELRLEVVHFPKGWLPLVPVHGVRTIATLADTIMHYYAVHYPGFVSVPKLKYFNWATMHTLRNADRIITISKASREALSDLRKECREKTTVTYLGPGLPVRPMTVEKEFDFLVMGSRVPHKATPETLRLLADYSRQKGLEASVRVAGLSGWPKEWGQEPAGMSIKYLGKVPDEDLVRQMGRARALVFLSYIEGFGLPLIEAYETGTPACYRDSTSLGEIMRGVPGGWDGGDQAGFSRALDEVMEMSRHEIAEIRNRLRNDFNWTRTAEETLEIYAEELSAAHTSTAGN
ncbi:MAG: glycosyltransferase [Verrucomicrobia bacterium]|nr:glycosyltransferase [Verrucomicrobiota bacterium]